jgi:hypothetical protein
MNTMSKIRNAAVMILSVITFSAASQVAPAQDGHGGEQKHRTTIDDNGQLAYFSPRLGARFVIQRITLPQHGTFNAARLVSEPEPDSPLLQIGLRQGDVITRLDGTPVTITRELERHILETTVRYIRAGKSTVQQGQVFIQQHHYFDDPVQGVVDAGNDGGLSP